MEADIIDLLIPMRSYYIWAFNRWKKYKIKRWFWKFPLDFSQTCFLVALGKKINELKRLVMVGRLVWHNDLLNLTVNPSLSVYMFTCPSLNRMWRVGPIRGCASPFHCLRLGLKLSLCCIACTLDISLRQCNQCQKSGNW